MKKFDYLTRRQIQQLHKLGGDRNARRLLANLAPFLSSFRGTSGESVFYLNKDGRALVNCDKTRQKTVQAGHYIMRADMFLHYGAPEEWKNEVRLAVDGEVNLVADSHFMHGGRRHLLEVDHLQHMSKNHDKIQQYKKLQANGAYQKRYGYFARLVWVTTTEGRKGQLLGWCEGMDVVVHLWSDIQ